MRIRGDHEKSGNNALTCGNLGRGWDEIPRFQFGLGTKKRVKTVWSQQPSVGELAASTVAGLRSCDGGFEFATIKE